MGNSTVNTAIPSPTHPNRATSNRDNLICPTRNPMAHTPVYHIQTSHKETINNINTISMNKNNKPNAPIPYTQTHTSRGQHPHQARIANNPVNKITNPPSAQTTPIGNADKNNKDTPIPSLEETITPITEPIPSITEPQSPTLTKRPRQMNNQPMMTSLPDYPAHGEPQLPDHAQSQTHPDNH